MAQIPIAGDVAAVIGKFAEKVENRSLLLDKFVFHKKWPIEQDERGRDVKWDEASRWSFWRISEGAQSVLRDAAENKERQANGRNVNPSKAERLRSEASMASKLSNVSWNDSEIEPLRERHTRHFLSLFRNAFPEKHAILIGQLEGRLAINLSDSLIENAGISLDRMFGLPYIPGSAVKGVCRHAALQLLKAGKMSHDDFQAIFGTSENDYKPGNELAQYALDVHKDMRDKKGCIDFLPAYPVNKAKIVVDLTNVHYPEYYRSQNIHDLSKENPRPNPFPVVEVGARFAFCLCANQLCEDFSLVQKAQEYLKEALSINGIGAKTACGYGWFSFPEDAFQELQAQEQQDLEKQEQAARLEAERQKLQEEQRRKLKEQEEAAERNRIAKEKMANMTPEQQADYTVEQWDENTFRNRLNSFDKKNVLTDDLKKAVVRACHGSRKELWLKFKEKATKGNAANIANTIRALSKELGLGKMP